MPQTTGGASAGAQQDENGRKSMFQSIIQGIGIFILMQVAMNYLGGNTQAKTGQAAPGGSTSSIGSFDDRPDVSSITNYSTVPYLLAPIWEPDSALDIRVHVSPLLQLPPLAKMPAESLVVSEDNFKMGDKNYDREFNSLISVPTEVQHNGTLFAHILAALHGHEIDPSSSKYDPGKAAHFIRPLNHYHSKKKARKQRNLLDKTEQVEEEPESTSGPQIASYYHPNFTLAVVPDTGIVNWRSMHPGLRRHLEMEATGARDASGQNGWYYPVFFLNTFWQLRSHMTELNDTVKTVPLNIKLYNMANWKYSIVASMDEGMRQQAAQAASGTPNPMSGGGDGSEFEKFKEILLDTNAYLLGTTFFVSILHMIFEGLAFKNDISHWRKKKDVVGTSVRTIVANVFMQTVIFLYLVDNSEGTSWMILAGQGFGILVEAWKITKTVNVVIRPPGPDSNFKFLPYVIHFEDKYKLSEVEEKTKEYDAEAFRYLYIVAVPLLLAYAAYSLVYETHKSWYSFIIETLVGSVYAYGFLMMVPSLWINYKLKSVAHMPGKAMTYKFLNTFIDDLFAFTIRMPILHRLATLRDDVIFFIWLYQKYVYKVDYTRVNEFGQGGESDDEDESTKKAGDKKALEGQDTKELKPTAPVASASGAEKNSGVKKRK